MTHGCVSLEIKLYSPDCILGIFDSHSTSRTVWREDLKTYIKGTNQYIDSYNHVIEFLAGRE